MSVKELRTDILSLLSDIFISDTLVIDVHRIENDYSKIYISH